jgi:iron complex outermembrane receptor protein
MWPVCAAFGSVGGAGAVAQALPRDFYRYVGGTVSVSF